MPSSFSCLAAVRNWAASDPTRKICVGVEVILVDAELQTLYLYLEGSHNNRMVSGVIWALFYRLQFKDVFVAAVCQSMLEVHQLLGVL